VETAVFNEPTAESDSLTALSYPMAEEFHVMGLRPMEFRPAIIRRAMHRSAAPLATAHLHHPDGVVERKLSLVATTGYRLLDPRRREDSLHRMMLGRIHPQLADEAARIAQSKGNQLTEADAAESDEAIAFIGGGLIKVRKQDPDSARRGHSQNRFVDESTSHWNETLQSTDLLIEPPIKRLFRTTRRWALQRYIAVASVSGLMIMTLVTWRMSRDDDAVAVADVALKNDALAIQNIEAVSLGQPSVDEVVEGIVDPIPGPLHDSTEVSFASADVQPEATPIVEPPLLESVVNPIAPAEIVDGMDVLAENAPVEERAVEAASEPKVESLQTVATKEPVPLASELEDRQKAWQELLSSLPANDFRGKTSQSFHFADEAAGGKLDLWVGLRGAAMFSVLSGSGESVDRAMLRLVDTFETDIETLAKNTAVEAIAVPLGVDETTNALQWLECWFGRSLVAGEMDNAAFFSANFNQLAKSSADRASSDRTWSARSKEITSSLETARRLADGAARIETIAEEPASASEQLTAGRYWALIRHQWAEALPHLAAGSDARLASLATSELQLGATPEPEALIDLAEGYLAMAKKANGWQETSYILHADEVLHHDVKDGANVISLELSRMQRQLRADREAVFTLAERLDMATMPPALTAQTSAATTSPADSVAEPGNGLTGTGLIGRIFVGGEDVGVSLRYEPGAQLTPNVLEQIGNRLKVDLSAAAVKFVGTIVVDHPTAVSILASNVIASETSISLIDENLNLIEPKAETGKVALFQADLTPGTWTIRWTVPKIDEFGSTFRVNDALSGIPITVHEPPKTLSDPPETMKTRLSVSVIVGQ